MAIYNCDEKQTNCGCGKSCKPKCPADAKLGSQCGLSKKRGTPITTGNTCECQCTMATNFKDKENLLGDWCTTDDAQLQFADVNGDNLNDALCSIQNGTH